MANGIKRVPVRQQMRELFPNSGDNRTNGVVFVDRPVPNGVPEQHDGGPTSMEHAYANARTIGRGLTTKDLEQLQKEHQAFDRQTPFFESRMRVTKEWRTVEARSTGLPQNFAPEGYGSRGKERA